MRENSEVKSFGKNKYMDGRSSAYQTEVSQMWKTRKSLIVACYIISFTFFSNPKPRFAKQILHLHHYQSQLSMMQKGIRQNSYSRQKTQGIPHKEDSSFKLKNNTNPTHDQQLSKELIIRRSEGDQSNLPLYRVAKTKFEKNNLRYSDNSPLKLKEKAGGVSPYRREEFEAYNFAHLGPLEHLQRKKKGRSYFYRRSEEKQEQGVKQEVSKNHSAISNHEVTQPHPEIIQQQKTTQSKENEGELTLQEMHYEMVKTYQKCKNYPSF